MTDEHFVQRNLIVDDHIVRFAIDAAAAPMSLSVEVYVDGRRVRSWEEPGWRDIQLGVTRGRPYWWSARRLVALPLDASERPLEVTIDEDVVFVFGLQTGWLVVAETSVRLLHDGDETARLELSDVVESCTFDGTTLHVAMGNAATAAIIVSATELQACG